MTPYLFLLAGILLLLAPIATYQHSLQRQASSKSHSVPWLLEIPAIVLLVSFAGFRYFVGTDSLLYHLIYERINPQNWTETFAQSTQEYGFTALTLTLRMISADSQLLFFTASLITVTASYISIRRLSDNTALSLILFLTFASYLAPLNTIRQGIAVAIFYLSISYFRENRLIGVALAVLSLTFHISAIVAILAVATLGNRHISTKNFFLYFVFGAFIAKLMLFEVPIFAQIIGALNPRYAEYLLNAEQPGIGTYLLLVVHLLIAIFLTTIRDIGQTFNLLRNIYLCTVPTLVLGTSVLQLTRISEYFSFALILLIPSVVSFGKRAASTIAIIISAFSVLYYFVYLMNYGGLLPYQDYFDILPRHGISLHIPK